MNSNLLMNDLAGGPASHRQFGPMLTPSAPLRPDSAATGRVDPASPPVRSRRLLRATAVFSLSAAVAGAGLWLAWPAANLQSTDCAFIEGHRIAVAAQVSGRVSDVQVRDNEHVKAGQVLADLDPANFLVKLQQAQAARAQAEGALARARAQLPVAEAEARQSRVQVLVAEANARQAADDLQRYQQLSANAVSRVALEAAATRVAVSNAGIQAARQAAAKAAAQIALARTGVATAEANVRAAAALVAQARLDLSYCVLKAPAAGFVTRKGIERGDVIAAGEPLMNLVTDAFFVTANFKETQLTHLRPGQPATITVDAYPGVELTGRVDSTMAGTGSAFALLPPENATGNFVKVVQRVPVKIVFDHATLSRLPRLALGMSVTATVEVSSQPSGNSNH